MIAISTFRGYITVARVPDLSIIAEIQPSDYADFTLVHLITQIVPRRIRWSPNGSRLAYGWWSGTVDIFDVRTQSLVTSLDQTDFSTPSVHVLCSCEGDLDWSPDGARILRTGNTGELLVFNVSSGRGLFKLGEVPQNSTGCSCYANPGVLSAFSPDGSMIATWGESLEIYDAASGGLITSTSIDGIVKGLAWSPDGELIALGTLKGGILVWRKSDGQIVSNTSGHDSPILSLSWKGSRRGQSRRLVFGLSPIHIASSLDRTETMPRPLEPPHPVAVVRNTGGLSGALIWAVMALTAEGLHRRR